ncbi:MAG: NHL repeat-containing protein [candidate division Zixibacteria bacterium]|nr:NHL repeat-containing protein [candidate division Zixibacteria bacterium]
MRILVILATAICVQLSSCCDSDTSPTAEYWEPFEGHGTEPGQFDSPMGVQFRASLGSLRSVLLVADYGNDRVQMFPIDDIHVYCFGEAGDGPGQFRGPVSITSAQSDSGDSFLFVTDSRNHRVQKFDVDGNFILAWGESGSDTGQFNTPTGIDADRDGNIYVVDSGNHRIQVFDENGNFQRLWGGQGTRPGEFESPIDIAEYDGASGLARLVVSDYGNNRIQVFDQEGDFIASHDAIPCPLGLGTSAKGNIWIVSETDRRLFIVNFWRSSREVYSLRGSLKPYDITEPWVSDMGKHAILWYSRRDCY